jgi:hypothetical protein
MRGGGEYGRILYINRKILILHPNYHKTIGSVIYLFYAVIQ